VERDAISDCSNYFHSVSGSCDKQTAPIPGKGDLKQAYLCCLLSKEFLRCGYFTAIYGVAALVSSEEGEYCSTSFSSNIHFVGALFTVRKLAPCDGRMANIW